MCLSLLIWTSILMGHLTLTQKLDLETHKVPPGTGTLLPEQGNASHCGHQKCITYAPLSAQHSHQWHGILSAQYLTDSRAVCRLKIKRAVKNWAIHPRANWREGARLKSDIHTIWQHSNFTWITALNMNSPILKLKMAWILVRNSCCLSLWNIKISEVHKGDLQFSIRAESFVFDV